MSKKTGIKLAKTYVYRQSPHGGETHDVEIDESYPTGTGEPHLEFSFDMGTDGKHEKLKLAIGLKDFTHLAEMMAQADRDAAILAFSKAMISTTPGRKSSK